METQVLRKKVEAKVIRRLQATQRKAHTYTSVMRLLKDKDKLSVVMESMSNSCFIVRVVRYRWDERGCVKVTPLVEGPEAWTKKDAMVGLNLVLREKLHGDAFKEQLVGTKFVQGKMF